MAKLRQVWIHLADGRLEEKIVRFLIYNYGHLMEMHRWEEAMTEPQAAEGSLLLTDVEDTPLLSWRSFGHVLMLDKQESTLLYQSGHELAARILSAFEQGPTLPVLEVSQDSPGSEADGADGGMGCIISVLSPVGGCGKSTFSYALAQALKEKSGGRVLYLNLEGANAWNLLFERGAGRCLSDLFYSYLMQKEEKKQGAEKLKEEIERLLLKNKDGIYSMAPVASMEDLSVLSQTEAKELLDGIRPLFQYIVCDLSMEASALKAAFVQASSRVFLLSTSDDAARAKLNSYLSALERRPDSYRDFMGKTQLVERGQPAERVVRFGKHREKERGIRLPYDLSLMQKTENQYRINRESEYYSCVCELAENTVPSVRTAPAGRSKL